MAKKKPFGLRVAATLSTIKSDTINPGFSDIDLWADLGNCAANRIMSGRFDKGLLFGRSYVFYGESGSGKSLEAAYVAANVQKELDAYVVWIDVENASDGDVGKEFFQRAGVNIGGENFYYTKASELGDLQKIISGISASYRKALKDGSIDDLQPLLIIVDSWSAALTSAKMEQAVKGELKGDMGQKAKQTGDLILASTHLLTNLPVMLVGIAHIMDSQEMYGRKHKTTGGHKMVYYASGCLMLTKKVLKKDDLEQDDDYYDELEAGMSADMKKKQKSHGIGIIAVMENLKSRVAKPFEKIEVQIPYRGGMDRYSGLFNLLMQEGVVTVPAVGWYQYMENGEAVKFRKADFRTHADRIMAVADIDIATSADVEEEDSVSES